MNGPYEQIRDSGQSTSTDRSRMIDSSQTDTIDRLSTEQQAEPPDNSARE